jgi:hypothetical protein
MKKQHAIVLAVCILFFVAVVLLHTNQHFVINKVRHYLKFKVLLLQLFFLF